MLAAVVPSLGAPLEVLDIPVPTPGPGQILVRIEARHLDNRRMLVEISNRPKHGGKDELPAATHEGTGLGLANVCQRLEARWGSHASCRYGAMHGGGYKVSLTMPVETNARD